MLQFLIQVTTYQKQYFYTDSLDNATEFVRAIADDIKRPFSVRFNNCFPCSCWITLFLIRYNPYTQTVEVLNNSDKILDMAKELKGDLAIVASALRKVQERDGELDPSVVSTFLTAGLDISPYGSRNFPFSTCHVVMCFRCTTPTGSPPDTPHTGRNTLR